MDPNAALTQLRDALAELADLTADERPGPDPLAHAEHTLDAAEKVVDAGQSLDDWLTSGGFAPRAWMTPTPATGLPDVIEAAVMHEAAQMSKGYWGVAQVADVLATGFATAALLRGEGVEG